MDLFDLLIIAFLLLPALLRWIGQKSQSRTGPTAGPEATDAEPHGESAFEQALREISRSLELEVDTAEPPRRASKQPRHDAPRKASREETAFEREEAFEHRGRPAPSGPAMPAMPFRKLKKTKIDTSPPPPPTHTFVHSPISGKLRRHGSARDAVLFSEILGPPVAYRGRRW